MPTKTRSGLNRDTTKIISEQIGVVKPEVKWEKALWKKQPFPDNYVPPSFLAELKALRTSKLRVARVRNDKLILSSTPTPSTVDFDLRGTTGRTASSCYRFVSGCFRWTQGGGYYARTSGLGMCRAGIDWLWSEEVGMGHQPNCD